MTKAIEVSQHVINPKYFSEFEISFNESGNSQ